MVARLFVAAVLLAVGCKNPSTNQTNPGGTIACKSASDCPSTLPMCHPDAKVCVGCIESFQTCGNMQMCDAATHTCVPYDPNKPCKRSMSDCPRLGIDNAKLIA